MCLIKSELLPLTPQHIRNNSSSVWKTFQPISAEYFDFFWQNREYLIHTLYLWYLVRVGGRTKIIDWQAIIILEFLPWLEHCYYICKKLCQQKYYFVSITINNWSQRIKSLKSNGHKLLWKIPWQCHHLVSQATGCTNSTATESR